MSKVNRNFMDNSINSIVSKHLLCIVCQDLLDDPKRINCGHTFCHECITKWTNENKLCPICKTKIIKKQISKDLIAMNILNDLQVTCNNLECCPWKGMLSELNRHLKICPFDDKRMSVNIKKNLTKTLSGELKNSDGNEDTGTGDYLSFNPKNASLKVRLFQKNPELMGKVLNEEEKVDDNYDIYAYVGMESRHIPKNNIQEIIINKTLDGQKNNINTNDKIEDSEPLDQCDINFIFPYDYERKANTNGRGLLRNKRRIRTINNIKENNNFNNADSVTSSHENMDDNEKRELEYALELSMRDKVDTKDEMVEDN